MALLLQSGDYLRKQDNGKLLLHGDPGAVRHVLAPAWRTADFGDGTSAVSWLSPLDPSELKTYTINCSTELNGIRDRLATVLISVSGLAVLAGLRIYAVTNDETQVTIWFYIDVIERIKSNWNPPGEVHHVTLTITSMNGHVFERTASITIRQLGQAA